MTINELRAKWEADLEAYDKAIEMFEQQPAYVEGIRHGAAAAIATKRYIQQMSKFRAEVRELLFAFPYENEG